MLILQVTAAVVQVVKQGAAAETAAVVCVPTMRCGVLLIVQSAVCSLYAWAPQLVPAVAVHVDEELGLLQCTDRCC
jgi:hypothetical protein